MPKKPTKSVSTPRRGTASKIEYNPKTGETTFTLKPTPTPKGEKTPIYRYKEDE